MSENSNYRPLIGITTGDPAGVGPEVAVKALQVKELFDLSRPFIIGDAGVIEHTLNTLKDHATLNVLSQPKTGIYQPGTIDLLDMQNVDCSKLQEKRISRMTGKASLEYIYKAIDLTLDHTIDAIVTGPIHKKAVHLAGCRFAGHTEIFSDRLGIQEFSSMIIVDNFRAMHVTLHTSLKNAIADLSTDRILKMIRLAHRSLKEMGIGNPKIAVPGLNPHSGDDGLFGDEEQNIIAPAIEAAKAEGIAVEGPVPPDTVFIKARGGKYDIVVALYHDQGHIPGKLLGWEWDEGLQRYTAMKGVTIVLGLPIIRTNPDHGTALEIAGEGIANSDAMVDAIKLAVQIYEGRRSVSGTSTNTKGGG
jgi:4-phospho-D-threonate 3-dehydrogenase / 4-phospho-D-erythronate 3-dehydrogenase